LYMTGDTTEIIVVVVTKDAILSKSRLHYYKHKIFDDRKNQNLIFLDSPLIHDS
jgi:hypothetical protein